MDIAEAIRRINAERALEAGNMRAMADRLDSIAAAYRSTRSRDLGKVATVATRAARDLRIVADDYSPEEGS